jgi:hypothetical protein
MASSWFETVAVAEARAKRRLRKSVYAALIAGSEKGTTLRDNLAAFDELGLGPQTAGQAPVRAIATTVVGQKLSLPVIISPTGVQGVRPDREVQVARAAAARGTAIGAPDGAHCGGQSRRASVPGRGVSSHSPGQRCVLSWTVRTKQSNKRQRNS